MRAWTLSRALAPTATALAASVAASALLAQAQPQGSGSIYTCTDDRGRRLTSDRPIPECAAKEQQVLNRDGSLKTIHPPTLTADERAEKDARERKAAEIRLARAEATRRDKNLLARYPSEAAHRKARENALESVRLAIKTTEQRLKDLAAERKPLLDEAEFYQGKALPAKLKSQIDANDAAVAAQRVAAANQEAELARLNGLYDVELARLQKLWAGAVPGSLGPLPSAQSNPDAR